MAEVRLSGDEPDRNAFPVLTAEDRSLYVPAGNLVATGYVPVEDVVLACRDRMAVGDVEASVRRLLQLGDASRWPPPVGQWRGDGRFILLDGRHEYVATLMLGRERIFRGLA